MICLNGGIEDVDGRCHCPNGFTGDRCQKESCILFTQQEEEEEEIAFLFVEDEQMCRGVNCFFNHPCGISRFGHTYRSKCFCRRGFQGEFCQSKGSLSFLSCSRLVRILCSGVLSNCSVSGCSLGGSCFEQLTGNQRWKFCLCQPGWIGSNCQKRVFSSSTKEKD